MFCPSCGTESSKGAARCASCNAALPATWPPSATLVRRPGLVTLLGVLNAISSVVSLGLAALLLVTGEHSMAWVVGFAYLVWGVASAACAHGLFTLRRYGRIIQIVKGALLLFAIPFGTILAVLVLAYMLQRHVAILFSERPAESLDASEVASLEWGAKAAAWQAIVGVTVCGLIFLVIVPIIAAVAVPNFLHAVEKARQKRTIINIETVAMALEQHAVDHNEYPRVESAEELRAALDQELLNGVAIRDGWDHELRVWTWSDGSYGEVPNRYVVASAGEDGEWEVTIPREYQAGETTRAAEDIVLMDGSFIRGPAGLLH